MAKQRPRVPRRDTVINIWHDAYTRWYDYRENED